jgi:hypothetical protein
MVLVAFSSSEYDKGWKRQHIDLVRDYLLLCFCERSHAYFALFALRGDPNGECL